MKPWFLRLICLLLLVVEACQAQPKPNNSTNMLFQKIPPSEYDVAILYYSNKAVQGNDVLEVLSNSKELLERELEQIPEDKITFRYGFGKWSVGEVLQHIISYERIMTERAMMIMGLKTSNFKYQKYTQASTAKGGNNKTKAELIQEFLEVRATTLTTFEQATAEQLKMIGTLDGFKISARMMSLCISGHQVHHFNVLKHKYKIF